MSRALFFEEEGGRGVWRKGVWRKGTRRIGVQQKDFAGLLCGAQGLTPGKRKILGTGSIRGETLKSFLRSGRLKSCFGEHDFSPLPALPGLKRLRSGKQCPRKPWVRRPLLRWFFRAEGGGSGGLFFFALFWDWEMGMGEGDEGLGALVV